MNKICSLTRRHIYIHNIKYCWSINLVSLCMVHVIHWSLAISDQWNRISMLHANFWHKVSYPTTPTGIFVRQKVSSQKATSKEWSKAIEPEVIQSKLRICHKFSATEVLKLNKHHKSSVTIQFRVIILTKSLVETTLNQMIIRWMK